MSKSQDLHEDKDTASRNLVQTREEPAVSDDDGKAAVADPPKTVRCIIERDFCDGYRKLGSGDFVCPGVVQNRPSAQRESSSERVTRISALDTSRLKNHLEWKRQKEIEHARKKEAERLEEQKREQDKMREEKEKKLKQKEREEKIREWQKQKSREKQEREREETVFRALEQEIKVVTQTIGKEKLIREWIRLKNKQKQAEAEKKAELLKKEEESKALRQSLAEISYRRWKESTKTRKISLPKNGYQIFGPKPVPVVKEDWNHDFTSSDTTDRGTAARAPKSTVSMTLVRAPRVSRTDLCSHHLCDAKKRSPSSHHLKIGKSKTRAENFNARVPDAGGSGATQGLMRPESSFQAGDHPRIRQPGETETPAVEKGKGENLTNCHPFHEEKFLLQYPKRFPSDCCASEKVNPKAFGNPTADVGPTKNRLNIYLKTSVSAEDLESEIEKRAEKPKKTKKKTVPEDNLKKLPQGKEPAAENSRPPIELDENLPPARRRISNGKISRLVRDRKKDSRSAGGELGNVKSESVSDREKPELRSQSRDAPRQKFSATDRRRNRDSSKSIEEKSKKALVAKSSGKQTKKPFGTATVKNSESKRQKKMHCRRKLGTPDGGDLSEKHLKSTSELRNNRKKTRMRPKSEIILADSPYTWKRGKTKSKRLKKNEEMTQEEKKQE